MTKSKIRINPVTMEIEIEVSDTFLEKYFDKLSNRFPKSKKLTPKITSIKTRTKIKGKKGSMKERIINILKKGKDDGVSIDEILKRTRLDRKQIYSVINILKSKGIINTIGRGKYSYIQNTEVTE